MNKHLTRRHRIGFVCAVLALTLAGCNGEPAAKEHEPRTQAAEQAPPATAKPSAAEAAADPAPDRPQLNAAALARTEPAVRPALQALQPPVDTGAVAKSDLATCERLCETTMRLKCDGDSLAGCESDCRESYALPMCRSEMSAFLACAAQRPLGDWECDPDTGASVRDGVCDREQGGVMQCVQALAAAGMPE